MKVIYETTVKVKAVYDINTLENLKSNSEFAEGLAQMVCDEITTAGGVGTYEVIESRFNIDQIKCSLECEKGNVCCYECFDRASCNYACDGDLRKCEYVC